MKLVQKHLIKGRQVFEILNDEVRVHIKSLFNKKTLSVPLAIINPEPVINGAQLEFHSRVKCGPLLTLWRDNPDAAQFTAFVDTVKGLAEKEFNDFAGLK